eukprot:309713-Chlamydomonas_euryale.AAC.1
MLAKGRLLCSTLHQLHVAEDGHQRVGAADGERIAVVDELKRLQASLGDNTAPSPPASAIAPYKRQWTGKASWKAMWALCAGAQYQRPYRTSPSLHT